ncbi:MAG: glycosyltransferase [Candidatus Diapherotrites archaeon]|uniref:Glycosyltransferase n=1 Tax=Candidatus Iainarchaeum sp. TaxID=3101447 RepID=A0A8T4L9V6_9ARCH|nr:glycosyltransferase [Candidatus Diapherotrites archaeon]
MPEVSVIVPALNEEKRIRACLESLRAQKFGGDFEVVVADGKSGDHTAEIAVGLADRVVTEARRSAAFERQKGALAARGKVLAFTDADAVCPRDWLENLCKPFSGKGVAATYGNVFLSEGSQAEKAFVRVLVSSYLGASSLLGMPMPIGSNMAVSREAFNRVGGFDTRLVTSEDIDLAKRVQAIGRVVYAPEAVVRVSNRRLRAWGYGKFLSYHVSNAFRYRLLGHAHADYEVVR